MSESESMSGDEYTTPVAEDAPSADEQSKSEVAPEGGRTVRWLIVSLVAVVLAAGVGIVMLLQATVPNGDLEDSEARLAATQADLASTRGDLAATEQQAASDLADAADREAGLNEAIAGLETDVSGLKTNVSGLEGDLAERDGQLADSQAESAALTEDLGAETTRADEAEATLAAAGNAVRESFEMWEFFMVWTLWAEPRDVRNLEREKADLTVYDELVHSLGLGDTWKDFAKMDTNDVLRELDNLMDVVDDSELRSMFDDFFDCDARRECIQTAVLMYSNLLRVFTEQMQSTGEILGKQLMVGSAF